MSRAGCDSQTVLGPVLLSGRKRCPSREDEPGDNGTGRRLRVTARREERLARLESLVAAGDQNLEDRIALLDERNDDAPPERDVSLRLLQHFTTSVRHQQYRNTDIVTLLLEPATRRSA